MTVVIAVCKDESYHRKRDIPMTVLIAIASNYTLTVNQSLFVHQVSFVREH